MRTHERAAALARIPLLLHRLLSEGRYDFTYDQMPISLRGMPWPKRINLARAGLNLLYRKTRPWSMPLHMQTELTTCCELHCPVCPKGTGELDRPPQFMPTALFRQIMSEAGPYLLTVSLWGWGESLLHPNLREILRAAAGSGAVTFLSTNGQHLDRESVLEAILDHPPCYLIAAIDGLTEEIHTVFRVGARLEPALRGIRRLAELKRQRGLRLPVLHMRFMAMKHNEHQLPALESFAAEHGFDMLSVRSLATIASEAGLRAHHSLLADSHSLRGYQYEGERLVARRDHVCMQPFWFPSVYADGTLVACEQDFNATEPLGAIGEGMPFERAWRSKAAADVRRFLRDHSGEVGFCRNCPCRDRPATDVSLRAVFLNPEAANPLVIEGNGA